MKIKGTKRHWYYAVTCSVAMVQIWLDLIGNNDSGTTAQKGVGFCLLSIPDAVFPAQLRHGPYP